jgi:hypothetical protein
MGETKRFDSNFTPLTVLQICTEERLEFREGQESHG